MASKQSSTSEVMESIARLAIKGQYDDVRQLATKELMKIRNDAGWTVLMLSANADWTPAQFEKCIGYFLHLGADPFATDRQGDTAAHIAARRDHLRCLALLPFDVKFRQNAEGLTPLMEAVNAGSWRSMKHLLHLFRQVRYHSKKKSLLGKKSKTGFTALDFARLQNEKEFVNIIERELRIEVVRERKIYGHTIYRVTGLSESEQDEMEERQLTALSGHASDLRPLVTLENCDIPNQNGGTTLMHVTDHRNDVSENETALHLLAGLSDVTSATWGGSTCLHGAAEDCNKCAIDVLVNCGAQVNAVDCNGRTPLMMAAESSSCDAIECMERLLSFGADWGLRDIGNHTALDWTSYSTNKDKAALLERYEGKTFFDQPMASPSHPRVVEGLRRTNLGDAAETTTDDCYRVTDPQGFCLIININKYKSDFEERKGSEIDVSRVSEVFAKLRFVVEIKEDLTTQEIDSYIHEKRDSQELENHGCFVCFLMAHGDNDCIYGSDGNYCEIKSLVETFGANVCKGLERKPKIFFIQACRGNSRRNRVPASGNRTDGAAEPTPHLNTTDARKAPLRGPLYCPAESDFLMCYANTEGSPAHRNTRTGSIVVQTLCDIIEKEYSRMDLLKIMTRLIDQVVGAPVQMGKNFHQVVPDVRTRLSKDVSLDPNASTQTRSRIRVSSAYRSESFVEPGRRARGETQPDSKPAATTSRACSLM